MTLAEGKQVVGFWAWRELKVWATVAALVLLGIGLWPVGDKITVHSIRVQDGIVLQDRTIFTRHAALHVEWAASIVDARTGAPVSWCSGYGSHPFAPGHRVAELSLPEWTGRPACTADSLPPGEYFPRASWRFGSTQVAADGDTFLIH